MAARKAEADDMKTLPKGFLLCTPEQLAAIQSAAEIVTAKNNEVLVDLGQFEPPVLVLLKGVYCLQNMGKEADKTATDFMLAPYTLTCGLLPRDVSPYEVQSMGATVSMFIPLKVFRSVLVQAPRFASWMMAIYVRALAQSRFYRARVATLSLEARMAYFYWTISEPVPGSPDRLVRVKIPQHSLCSYFGVAREEISRKRKTLERAGYLTPDGPTLRLSSELVYLFSLQAPAPLENPWNDEDILAVFDGGAG